MTVPRRILALTPFPPNARGDHGGSRAIGQLLGQLAEGNALTIAALRAPSDEGADEHLASRARIIEVPTASRASLSARVRHRAHLRVNLARGVPLRVTETANRSFAETVRRICNEWPPDIVQIEFDVMGQYVSGLVTCAAPRIVVMHEPGLKTAQEGREPGGALVHRLDVAAWKRFERRLLAQVQATVVFTDNDRRAVEPFAGSTPVLTIPPGVAISADSGPIEEEPGLLVFVGNFIHPPNVDAARRLALEIFPRIRECRRETTLELVGASPPAEVQALHGNGVTVTGRVPDVEPYLARASVIVVPLRQGGGMRIKVLDALAFGKAMVTSRLAVDGLDPRPAVKVADSDEQFAEAVVELLDDPAARYALGRQARAWAEEHLRWDRTVSAYEELYDRLLVGEGTP